MSIGAVRQGEYGAYSAGYSAAGDAKDAFGIKMSAAAEKAATECQENTKDASYDAERTVLGVAPNAPEAVKEAWMEAEDTQADPMQMIREYMEQIIVKIQNGDAEPKFQIGGQSFTEKEWEKLLKNFDAAEEAIRAAQKEEIAKRTGRADPEHFVAEDSEKGVLGCQPDGAPANAGSLPTLEELLTAETTKCSYPAANPDGEDIRYITWYTEEGIFCRKVGQTEGYVWMVPFENKEQYDRVMELLARFPADYNFRFAAHENFWQDYLSGEMDEEAFLEFMAGTDNGIPNYGIGGENEMWIDEGKIRWAPYFNQPGAAKFYTAEEMQEMVRKEIEANASKLTRRADFSAYADS